jgi:hypothetical protein
MNDRILEPKQGQDRQASEVPESVAIMTTLPH